MAASVSTVNSKAAGAAPSFAAAEEEQEPYDALQKRLQAAQYLMSDEIIIWFASARNESIPQTRLHFEKILHGVDPSVRPPLPSSSTSAYFDGSRTRFGGAASEFRARPGMQTTTPAFVDDFSDEYSAGGTFSDDLDLDGGIEGEGEGPSRAGRESGKGKGKGKRARSVDDGDGDGESENDEDEGDDEEEESEEDDDEEMN